MKVTLNRIDRGYDEELVLRDVKSIYHVGEYMVISLKCKIKTPNSKLGIIMYKTKDEYYAKSKYELIKVVK